MLWKTRAITWRMIKWHEPGRHSVRHGPVAHAPARERLRTDAEISEMIRDALAQFNGPIRQDDDLTFVIVKVL